MVTCLVYIIKLMIPGISMTTADEELTNAICTAKFST